MTQIDNSKNLKINKRRQLEFMTENNKKYIY